MTLHLDAPDLAPLVAPLSAYGRKLVEGAGREALRLFADEVEPEHLLLVALADEENAAHRACLHAFADPETIVQEALALASGILVVGSAAALPFSPRAVVALRAARSQAAAQGAAELDGDRLLAASVSELEPQAARALVEAGYTPPSASAPQPGVALREGESSAVPAGPEAPGSKGLSAADPLFRDTTSEARRVLSSAARIALRDEQPAIAPAHVVLAALENDRERATRCGLTAARARLLLQGRSADPSEPPRRELRASDTFREYLSSLPPGAGSIAMLLGLLEPESVTSRGEISLLLARHRVTRALLERSMGMPDPD